jgi:hypothetical protein
MTEPPTRERGRSERGAGKLIRLVYVSVASRPLSSSDLDHIEKRSGAENGAAGITGFIVAHEPFFYSIMEGPRGRLFAKMERIIIDPLHQRLRVLREEPLADRRFLDWRLFRLPPLNRSGIGQAPSTGFILDLARRLG